MLSTIKTYALMVLGALVGVFGFMWQMTRANYAKAVLKGSEAARKTEKKATDAMVKGLEDENKATGDTSDGKFLD